jgi:hypothetical protein
MYEMLAVVCGAFGVRSAAEFAPSGGAIRLGILEHALGDIWRAAVSADYVSGEDYPHQHAAPDCAVVW